MLFSVQQLPQRRNGHTTAVRIGGDQFSLTANGHGDGTLAEVYVRWGKQGSASSGLMDAYVAGLSLDFSAACRHRRIHHLRAARASLPRVGAVPLSTAFHISVGSWQQ
jgi:hypothetical protein